MKLRKFISKIFSTNRTDPNLNNLTSGKTFEEQLVDLGVFQYFSEGFSIQYEDFFKEIKWNDITELNVYKADLMTTDRIEMEIVYGDKWIMISEELPGWYQFVLQTKTLFPAIPEDWDWEIVQPPFATNWRNIYRKG